MLPNLFGVGLRSTHYAHLLTKPKTQVGWFEALSENYIDTRGRPFQVLQSIREDYSVGLHGVSLSIGSASGLSKRYLDNLKTLIGIIDPFIVSDHLCWGQYGGENTHDLLPVPLNEESFELIKTHVNQVQEHLGRTIALENISTYLTYKHSTIPEEDFLSALCEQTGCGILLDINNLYVNTKNHGIDPLQFLDRVCASSVWQIHLAGFTDAKDYLFDTHSDHVHPDVWELYRYAIPKLTDVPVLIEWDSDIPAWDVLEAEALKAKAIKEEIIKHKEVHVS